MTWDEATLAEVLHEDAELHQPPTLPYGGVHRGRGPLMELWKEVIVPLHDHTTLELDCFLVDGDRALVIASADTTNGGKSTVACQDFVVRDGRIASIRMFWFDPTPVAEEANAQASRGTGSEQDQSRITRAVIERFYASLGSWDEDAIRACLHEDAELHQPPTLPYGGVYRGPDAMMELWKNIVLRLSEPGTAYIDSMIVDGDKAIVIAGSNKAGSGKPTLACEDYLVRDGRIARIRMFWFDPMPVAEAADALAAGRL
jgi:ketosteroid isomerase-like protein